MFLKMLKLITRDCFGLSIVYNVKTSHSQPSLPSLLAAKIIYVAFNAPRVGHKDDELQARICDKQITLGYRATLC